MSKITRINKCNYLMINGMVCGEKTSKIVCSMHRNCRPLKNCVVVDCVRSTQSKSGFCAIHKQACENSKKNYMILTKYRKVEKSYLKALPKCSHID